RLCAPFVPTIRRSPCRRYSIRFGAALAWRFTDGHSSARSGARKENDTERPAPIVAPPMPTAVLATSYAALRRVPPGARAPPAGPAPGFPPLVRQGGAARIPSV